MNQCSTTRSKQTKNDSCSNIESLLIIQSPPLVPFQKSCIYIHSRQNILWKADQLTSVSRGSEYEQLLNAGAINKFQFVCEHGWLLQIHLCISGNFQGIGGCSSTKSIEYFIFKVQKNMMLNIIKLQCTQLIQYTYSYSFHITGVGVWWVQSIIKLIQLVLSASAKIVLNNEINIRFTEMGGRLDSWTPLLLLSRCTADKLKHIII